MVKTRDLLGELVGEGSIKRMLSRRTSFEEELEEMRQSPSGQRKWISELSPVANVIVARCSRVLDISMDELQRNFDAEASDVIKHRSCYARNFLEYCCFRAIALSVQMAAYLTDKNFRRLTFDMMLAWEAPSAASQPEVKVDRESKVGVEAFSRIAPAVAIIADVITSTNVFDVLTSSTGAGLIIKKMKAQSESSHLSSQRAPRGERILGMEGTLTTQPVLEHVGMSIWPGRLTLTDHALYFEPLRVLTYDKPKIFDLADDLKQVIRPELTGPWGARLFDKGVMYKSVNLSEPVVLEFPELTGHSRRDYWMAILQEVHYAHKFIRKYQIRGVEREETLSRAVLAILRLQALEELYPAIALRNESLLMFNLTYQLPGGDVILETLASMAASRESDRTNRPSPQGGMNSMSTLTIFSNLGFSPRGASRDGLLVGEIVVGEMSSLERAVRNSRNNFKAVESAQASVNGVKVEGINNNLAVMKELLYPVTEFGRFIGSLQRWDDPLKSLIFCTVFSYIFYRVLVMLLLHAMAIFLLTTRLFGQGGLEEIRVKAPPPMNTVENLLAVQNAVSQFEELAQDGNIILLKIRSLILAIPPQATNQIVLGLVLVALAAALIPSRLILFAAFLEAFTRNSPPRRPSTERWMRRLREWWVSIPAAPVTLDGDGGDKKRK
ncbi:unnamed protein product [Spirodela intermedia]|uniref:Uncharacterized protein n=1 Tax=Spirodela intermedia TaxID=51605 RepID=A0A7I8J6G7_SPIIN|nr:unnamed protein product [Spirodela intermedia]CAA6665335.1 unnamed protein product [Spirodela intermedia]